MMKQDEQLKELLQKYAVESTSNDFTAKTMKRINSLPVNNAKVYSVRRILVALFIIVAFALAITSYFIKPLQIPVEFKIELPAFLSHHLYDFFILIPAFWLLVFVNRKYEKAISR